MTSLVASESIVSPVHPSPGDCEIVVFGTYWPNVTIPAANFTANNSTSNSTAQYESMVLETFVPSEDWRSWRTQLIDCFWLAVLIGILFFYRLSDFTGRVRIIRASAIICLAGIVWLLCNTSVEAQVVARAVTGFGARLSSPSLPSSLSSTHPVGLCFSDKYAHVYVAGMGGLHLTSVFSVEILPDAIRGRVISAKAIFICAGHLIAVAVAFGVSDTSGYLGQHGWRVMLVAW